MIDDRFTDEIQALLSAYAAGTLTPEEKNRLFEKSLTNQKLFDALADEESMRAALSSPQARQSLAAILESVDPSPPPLPDPSKSKLLWAAVAACLLFGIISVTLWPTKPAIEVAVVNQPVLVAENKPQQQPVVIPEQAAPKPPAPAKKQTTIAPAPEPREEKLADQPPAAPPVATPVPIELKAKKEEQDVKLAAESRADAADKMQRANAAERQANRLAAPAASSVGGAAPALAKAPPIAAIGRNNLAVTAPPSSHVYAFLIDGDNIRPLTATDEAKRLFPLGTHSAQAEVWLLVTATEDPVLERALTGVLPLPTRNWIKLKMSP